MKRLAGGGAARCHVAGDRRAHAFSGYPAGTRALQLPDTQVKSEFLTSFGGPPRLVCDAAERSSAPSVGAGPARDQRRHAEQEAERAGRVSDAGDQAGAVATARILDHLFLSAYSRYPTDAEKQPMLAALRKARTWRDRRTRNARRGRQALEDMMWAMLTSKEFLFNY